MFEKVFSGDLVEIIEGEHKGQRGEYYATSLDAGYLVFLGGEINPIGFSRNQFKIVNSPTLRGFQRAVQMS